MPRRCATSTSSARDSTSIFCITRPRCCLMVVSAEPEFSRNLFVEQSGTDQREHFTLPST